MFPFYHLLISRWQPGSLDPSWKRHIRELLFKPSSSASFAVIRAKVVGEKEVNSGNDIYGNPIKRIQYDVKQIKVSSDHNNLPLF